MLIISQINARQAEIQRTIKSNKKAIAKAIEKYESGLKGWDMAAKNLEIENKALNKEFEELTKQKINSLFD